MKVGLAFRQMEKCMAGQTPRWVDLRDMALTAEECGFDSLWFPDHLWLEPFPPFNELVPDERPQGAWESWSLLAALAASTSRIELGSLVTAMRFRNPAFFAKIVDVVEEVSGGRTIVGLGAGGRNIEYKTFGMPTGHHFSRFAEGLELFCELIRTGTATYSGEYYSADNCVLQPRGPREKGPPILVGFKGDKMLGLATRLADICHGAWMHDLSALKRWSERVEQACEAGGRDPATLDKSVSVMVDLPGSETLPEAEWVAAWRGTSEPISGSLKEIADHLNKYADLGISHIQVWLAPNTVQGIETFSKVLGYIR